MSIIYLLIPLSLVLVIAAVGAFFWAVRSGQFDDLHTPALKILDDDSKSLTPTPLSPRNESPTRALTKVEGQSNYTETPVTSLSDTEQP